MKIALIGRGFAALLLLALCAFPTMVQAGKPMAPDKTRVVDHWTGERRAAAIPRDLVVDPRGLGYLRRPDGTLEPYGHRVAAQAGKPGPTPSPFAKPVASDTKPPAISALDPAAGSTIGTSYTFSANVTDKGGVASVTFLVRNGGAEKSIPANLSGTSTWTAGVSDLVAGASSWQVVARDATGNQATSAQVNFSVAAGGDPTVASAHWSADNAVKKAAGRIYFQMPANKRKTVWTGYVCSGTVVVDATSGRSILITAAHCVYDDVYKAFARNVLFIPDQDATTGAGTDLDCSNDPIGCWVPSWGMVDRNWSLSTFPANIPWDYAYYVVADAGAHSAGLVASSDVLDSAAGALPASFLNPAFAYTHALGYSYSDDPNFMYCAETMTTEGADNWWLPSCALSGGSSGGPWVQPMDVDAGSGPIISVNSWGYTTQPGMAGPKLYGTSASCVFAAAKAVDLPASAPDGGAGTAVICP